MRKPRPSLAWLAFLLTSCTTASLAVGVPENHPGPVAVVSSYTRGPILGWFSAQVPASVRAVDDQGPAREYRLLPGTHRFSMEMRGRWNRFSGDVPLPVPAARTYEVVARWNDRVERFEVALMDVELATKVAEASVGRTESGPEWERILNPLNWVVAIPVH